MASVDRGRWLEPAAFSANHGIIPGRGEAIGIGAFLHWPWWLRAQRFGLTVENPVCRRNICAARHGDRHCLALT
jgi:hypothetical protein